MRINSWIWNYGEVNMTTHTMVKRPPRILVGVFDKAADLWSACRALELALGIPRDFVGVISRGDPKKDHHGEHDNLISLVVPLGKQEEITSLLKKAGATRA